MSAITGILYYDPAADSYESVQAMMRSLRKYPADAARTWHGDSISMGCHAQWVTPESVYDTLPYYDERYRLAITADAIIDNRQQLFEQLQIDNAKRQRITDSELILMAYRRWGEQAPRYLIGDFAFMIWDPDKRRLFGARDLMGYRALYYYEDERRFAFSTTLTSLFSLDGVMKALNEEWLAQYLAIPGMLNNVDLQTTAYIGIRHIPPAHTITVENGRVALNKYRTLEPPVQPLRLKSNEEYEEAFREVFEEAVASKLRTFRPVCASLSGGLDSGTVVSFAASMLHSKGKQLTTYSYVPLSDFQDWTHSRQIANETPFIDATVQYVGGLKHHYLDFSDYNSLNEIDQWIEILDSPYKCFENSFWLRGIYEQASKDGNGLLLTGQGGNLSISWGYAIDYYGHLLKRMRLLKLYSELKQFGRQMAIRRKYLMKLIVESAYPMLDRTSSPGPLNQLIHPDFARKPNIAAMLKRLSPSMPDDSANFLEAREDEFKNLLLPHETGRTNTLFSLQYGLIERDPTYDPRVIEFCLSVPLEQYVQNGVGRSLIRRATKGYLPDKVRLNQRIQGVQGADWLHRVLPSWRLIMDELLQLCNDSLCHQVLNMDQIKKSMAAVGREPKSEHALYHDIRLLMRSLVTYRFMKRLA